ncbi:MAG: hypothetical protein AAFV62_05635, partial [Pseudomonadota bacterium]
ERAHVRMLSNGTPGEDRFGAFIEDCLGPEKPGDPWSELARTVAEAYVLRQELLLKLTSTAPRRTLRAI